MKTMRQLMNIVESVSSVVYHATDMLSAKKILESNSLKSKSGQISVTRSLTGSYHRENKMIGVIFELDGNLLNQQYKSAPVGTENFLYDPDEEDDDEQPFYGKQNGQLEDRIYAAEITPFSKYVKSAIVFIPEEYINRGPRTDEFGKNYHDQLRIIGDVENLLENYGIPTKIVETEKDLYRRR